MKRPGTIGAVALAAFSALVVRAYVDRLAIASVFAAPTPRALAHFDHTPRYGGLVLMNGDTHFEVVVEPFGHYSVYFTDAVRAPLPASTAVQVHVDVTPMGRPPETIPMEIDATGTRWVGRGAGVDDPNEVVRITYVPETGPRYWIDVPASAWPRAIASLRK